MRMYNLQWSSRSQSAAFTAAMTGTEEAIVIDPPLSCREEAIFLLHVAAEIEHSLLVQYVYAAFSLRLTTPPPFAGSHVPANPAALTAKWFGAIFQTAQEEMGHLMTVQNLLRALGGPLAFEREDFPFRSDVYPFHFRLQPLTKSSLAKYVAAERPDQPEGLSPDEKTALDKLLKRFDKPGAEPVNRVGRVYTRLIETVSKLSDGDFVSSLNAAQATADEWHGGSEDRVQRDASGKIVAVGDGAVIFQVKNKKDAVDALSAIAIQGEGAAMAQSTARNAHFWRFFNIYLDKDFPDDTAPMRWHPERPVGVNTNTTKPGSASPADEVELAKGRITNEQTRLWAQLFNVRYRMLLACIAHSLNVPPPDPKRQTLIDWAFEEMGKVGALAGLLADLDRTAIPGDGTAGAPFELPYTLGLPDDDRDRWRLEKDLLYTAALIYKKITPKGAAQTNLLTSWKSSDGADDNQGRRKVIADILQGSGGSGGGGGGTGGGPVSFATDIRPLFRPIDVAHMGARGVHLDDYAYMSNADGGHANATDVLDVLTSQQMPPGGPFWSAQQLALFQKWMTDGYKP